MGSKASAPPPPDYASLATQQATLNKQAADEQTKANRVNQTNAYGTSTWNQDPQGQWTQTQTYNPEYQQLLDSQRQNQQQLTDTSSGMLAGIKDQYSQPLDLSGLTRPDAWQNVNLPDTSNLQDWGKLDFSDNPALADSGFGGVEEVQKAMMSRLQPGLDQGNAAEVARLKSQGITEGSPAWQAAMQSQGQRANDASQQALLGSMGAYGDIFNRSLQARQLANTEDTTAANYANALRGQQFGEGQQLYTDANQQQVLGRTADTDDYTRQLQEALLQRGLPMQEYQQLMSAAGGAPPGLNFGSFFNEGNAGAADVAGAADKTYAAQMQAYNAAQTSKAGMLGGLGSVAGSFFGPIGTAVGGALGTAVGNKLNG